MALGPSETGAASARERDPVCTCASCLGCCVEGGEEGAQEEP